MSEQVLIRINGAEMDVGSGISVAAAILMTSVSQFRTSVSGEARGPLCGTGICFECRVTINGQPNRRSCQIPVVEGMDVRTG